MSDYATLNIPNVTVTEPHDLYFFRDRDLFNFVTTAAKHWDMETSKSEEAAWTDVRDGDVCQCCLSKHNVEDIDLEAMAIIAELLPDWVKADRVKTYDLRKASRTFWKTAAHLDLKYWPDEDEEQPPF